MNLRELKKRSNFFRPVIWTDRILSKFLRISLIKILSVLLLILMLYYLMFEFSSGGVVLGLLLVLFSLWAPIIAWQMFYNSLEGTDPHTTGITPLVSGILFAGSSRDVTKSFLKSKIGKSVLKRFSISDREVKKFLSISRRIKYSLEEINVDDSNFVDLPEYVGSIIEQNLGLREFLFTKAIDQEQVVDLCQWLERDFYTKLEASRWWSRDRLMRVPSIGEAFSYGRAYLLEEFSLKVESSESNVLLDYFEEELERVEDILTRSQEANALVIGSHENLHLINLLQKKIQRGNVHPQIEHKDLFVLDTEGLISISKEKAIFEQNFIKILKEIVHAGNVILVIDNLPEFIINAQSLGSGVVPILEPYLSGRGIQVVAFSDEKMYHRILEPNEAMREVFEEVMVPDKENEIIRILVKNHISSMESKLNIFFEYKAVDAIVMGIERYFVRNSPIDEVADTLVDLTERIRETGQKTITKEDVLGLFEEKTGIPMQEAGDDEKKKLINLEEILHRRVIGQDDAIKSISDALRRVRSGISNPNRPMGTFLFLGPTGVGKTETTKALAQNFFDNEKNIKRLDMSEFSSVDALDRLIGSFKTGEIGVLTSMLREDPYGVLLLDEFEKASSDVHDLFLQILDEGVFSDMRGEKVNAKNLLIIATSNAGSDLIWQYTKGGKNVSEHEEEIVNSIIERKIFKPELVNRFDSVVVFHPLEKEHIIKIAEIMMRKLADRLASKGVKVSLSEDAMDLIIEDGVSSEFGARELNRVLQDRVESTVARMMLEGRIKRGDSLTLSREELV